MAGRIVVRVVQTIIRRSKFTWDDIFIEKDVFVRLAHLAPALVIRLMAPVVFMNQTLAISYTQKAAAIYMLVAGALVADAFLSALIEVLGDYERKFRVPFRACLQVVKIVAYFVVVIYVFATLLGKGPGMLLTGMAGLTAVMMFIFKDTILGFVGGVQLTVNDMVRIGDWIEMPKYGADGDVIDIKLTTVKVQNFDKTISTIPTYALVSDSFKNWRGMSESGGRRIKRSVHIDMSSIRFCTDEMLERYSKYHLITDYIARKRKEIAEYNAENKIDGSQLVNGRRMTNIGTFRAYVEAYLRNHPKIHPNMTFLIRQLAPTPEGLPIEMYVFTNDNRWAPYEAIQADIFDHILAVVPQFDLRVFQNPSGGDFRRLIEE
ncbi:mechanosensitive ion channel [Candidatus Sumerlaeota bacterium]|nr:mechanosensitive ion channel [Candidatus Sumerlaeota bacterium]